MSLYKIEKNIPIRTSGWGGRGHRNGRPLSSFAKAIRDAEVGDSFLIPFKKQSSLFTVSKRFNKKCVSRREDEKTCRVWITGFRNEPATAVASTVAPV